MLKIIIAFILLLATGYWFLVYRRNHLPMPAEIKSQSSPRGKYHAVSIKFGNCGCSAVEGVGNKRFLTSGNVPGLPLGNCAAATCQSKYVRHQDRRSVQGSRRAVFSVQTDMYGMGGEVDRRQKRTRRTSDSSTSAASDFDYADIEWTT
jgi:hypothetical protein